MPAAQVGNAKSADGYLRACLDLLKCEDFRPGVAVSSVVTAVKKAFEGQPYFIVTEDTLGANASILFVTGEEFRGKSACKMSLTDARIRTSLLVHDGYSWSPDEGDEHKGNFPRLELFLDLGPFEKQLLSSLLHALRLATTP